MSQKVAHLEHRQEFEAALTDYKLSPEAQSILLATPLVLIAGPSSVGRDTMIQELVKGGDFYDIVTSTTRPPRENNGVMEQDGVEYHFRSEAYMLEELRAGRLLGPAIIHNQQVSGMSIAEFETANHRHQIAVTDLDPVGTVDIAALKPNVEAIFVLPPSFDEWIARISKRGAPTREELERRLQAAIKEFTIALEHDIFTYLINDELSKAVQEVREIAQGQHHAVSEEKARQLARELRQQTEAHLQQF